MEPKFLVIRNLTSSLLVLSGWERLETQSVNSFESIRERLTSFIFTHPIPSPVPPIELVLGSHDTYSDYHLHIEPFTSATTEIAIGNLEQKIRLELSNEGQQYHVDIQGKSCTLTTSSATTKIRRSAIYITEHSHLVLLSSANLSAWMRELDDRISISSLSVPGTHNSPTCHRALPSVRCQAVSPAVQLEHGVRFFDVRLQIDHPEDLAIDSLSLVHSAFPISLTGAKYFRDLVKEISTFLRHNPSETIIMSLKREGIGRGTDAQLSRILHDHYLKDSTLWYTSPRVPTLGESRKKVVVVRRFNLDPGLAQAQQPSGWCINAASWGDNSPNTVSSGGELCIQDFYEVLDTQNIDKKLQYCEAHLERSAIRTFNLPRLLTTSPNGTKIRSDVPLFINFLSASNFWNVACWPERIAAKLNPAILDYLCRKHNERNYAKQIGDGATGVVVCDWVGDNGDWNLVECIIAMNARLMLRVSS